MTSYAPAGPGRKVPTSLAGPLGVAALAAAAVAVVATVDPNEAGHYPTCPFLSLTGQVCPGCGSLRAVHALAHGDVGTALGLNLLTVLAVVPLVVIWARWLVRTRTGASRSTVAPAPVLWALLVVVVAFGVLRNLPAFTWLAP
jgi:uncharacterized protein DUF2752